MSNGAGGHKRTKEQVAADKNFMVPLFLTGVSYQEIARRLEQAHGRTISHVQVFRDMQAVMGVWQKEMSETITKQLAIELKKIDNLERMYFEGYERSLQPQEKSKSKRGGMLVQGQMPNPNYVHQETQTVGRVGDPRWLLGIQWCIEKRCELLNLKNAALPSPDDAGAMEVAEIVFTVKKPGADYEEAEIIEEDEEGEPLINLPEIN